MPKPNYKPLSTHKTANQFQNPSGLSENKKKTHGLKNTLDKSIISNTNNSVNMDLEEGSHHSNVRKKILPKITNDQQIKRSRQSEVGSEVNNHYYL